MRVAINTIESNLFKKIEVSLCNYSIVVQNQESIGLLAKTHINYGIVFFIYLLLNLETIGV